MNSAHAPALAVGEEGLLPPRMREAPIEAKPDAAGLVPVAMLALAAVVIRLLLLVLGPWGNPEAAAPAEAQPALVLAMQLTEQGPMSVAASPEAVGVLPGYALLVAGFHAVGAPLVVLLLIQAMLGGVITFLTYHLGRAILKSERCAAMAAAVVALHPALIVSSLALLPDTVVVTLVLSSLVVVARPERHDFAGSALAGLALGAVVLLQPMTLLLGPAVGLWMIFSGRRGMSIIGGGIFAAASLVPAVAWMGRNQMVGQPLWPHSTSFWTGSSLASDAATDPARLASLVHDAALPLFASHDVPALYARLGLTPPQGLPDVAALALLEPAAWTVADASLWLAYAWSLLNLLLLAAAAMGLLMLVVRGRWLAILLLAPLPSYALWAWAGGDAERTRQVSLAAQALLVAACFLPGVRAALVSIRLPKWKARAAAEEAQDAEPVVVREGRPL